MTSSILLNSCQNIWMDPASRWSQMCWGLIRSPSWIRFLSVSSMRLGLWGAGCQKPSLRKRGGSPTNSGLPALGPPLAVPTPQYLSPRMHQHHRFLLNKYNGNLRCQPQ